MKNTLISVAVIATIHAFVSVCTAIDSGIWEWYASFLGAVGVSVFCINRAVEINSQEAKANVLDGGRPVYFRGSK
jgi:hypothetical protein